MTTGLSLIDGFQESLIDDQVQSDLTTIGKRHGHIQPKMYIYYDRMPFRGKNGADFRITIDENLLYRDWDISLSAGKFGADLLDTSKIIMEVKVPDECPEWLTQNFEKYGVEQGSFSKYGSTYRLANNLTKEEITLTRNTI